jgi:hypothetical protein
LIHINGVGNSLARITPAAITSAELVIGPPGLLGSCGSDHHWSIAYIVREVDPYAAA